MEKQKTVLIVDDEKELAHILSQKLEREGIKTLVANDGDEGLRVSRAQKPDLVLLDIVMPKMDGLTMLKELRKDEWGKDAEVILLTVLNDPESLSEAMGLKSFEYFVKTDWDIDDIVKRVKIKLGI